MLHLHRRQIMLSTGDEVVASRRQFEDGNVGHGAKRDGLVE
jgi:hypothetical protein